jgi:electron transfer flavoprotein beta subunit
MNIFVFIKRVPDTESNIRIGDDKTHIVTEDLHHITNPYDDYAIEEAIKIKENHGGEVTVISLGTEKAVEILRRALAMGADNALLLKHDNDITDPYVIAKSLADYTRKNLPDIIFFGKQAVDNDNAQVGAIFAEILDLPCVTVITELKINENKIAVKRESDSGTQLVEVEMPAVFTTQKGLNEPRLPALIKIMKARKKEIPIEEPVLEEEKIDVIEMNYPPPRGAGKIVGEGKEAAPELVKLLKEEAQVL